MNLPFVSVYLHPTQSPTHASPTHFRNYLTRHAASSRKRVIHIPDAYRLTATPKGGDCFFHALSWSLPYTPTPQSLRQKLSRHVRKESSFYTSALISRGFTSQVTEAREQITNFCERVLVHGPHGHWLGALWGELEILACVRAFDVRVELFTFDVRKQVVRPYFEVGESGTVVRMLFTGRAQAGHFDALLPVRSVNWDLWKRFVKRPRKR